MTRLWEIADSLGAVAQALDSTDPGPGAEAPDLNEMDLWEEWQRLDLAMEQKVEATALLARDHQLDADKCKAEIGRLTQKRATHERHLASLKDLLRLGLGLAGRKRMDCDRIKVRTQPCPPSTVVLAPEEVPAEYVRRITVTIPAGAACMSMAGLSEVLGALEANGAEVLREVDANKAKAAISGGVAVPGVVLRTAPDTVVIW